ncbi:MAG TPA: hypothetical protein VJO33_07850 [Gemmatimonadaceae bacterium]|nr:hypothetical protein [Gemmatimonadaceae bacterium]
MIISRRTFLGCAAGAVAVLRLPPVHGIAARTALSTVRPSTILDLEEHCCLRESLVGYRDALGALGPARREVLIVPGVLGTPPWAARRIAQALDDGATVILESGAGFASAREFRAHRAALDEYFQIRIEEPVPLWPARATPYVDFTWPSAVRIRDFTRAIPLASQPGEIIARAGDCPVALARRVGVGTLVFLGSPVGPALRAGDTQAHGWLADVVG